MNKHDIDKAYISPYDRFLFEFDKKHPKSLSQQQEIKKHKWIAERRDQAIPKKEDII